MKKKILNFGWGNITVQYNEADMSPTDVLIYDTIGRDPWREGGISATDVISALSEARSDRPLNFKVNSKGGDVHEGMAIMNAIKSWKAKNNQKVVTVIDGIAASTASWAFPCASDEVHAYRGSQMFIHDAIALGYGNAGELRKTADDLDKTSNQIAGMYAEKTGKSLKAMRDKMIANTLMTGEEAEEEEMVDKIIDGKSVKNFTASEVTNMTNFLTTMQNSIAELKRGDNNKNKNIMNKAKIVAMLNTGGITEWEGVKVTNETSEEHIEAALQKMIADTAKKSNELIKKDSSVATLEELSSLRNDIKLLTEANSSARTLRLTNEVELLVKNDQLTEKEKPLALARLLKDETYLNELKSRPVLRPGSEPLSTGEIDGMGEGSFKDVQNFLLRNGPKFMSNFIGSRAGDNGEVLGDRVLIDIRDHQMVVANTIQKNKKMLIEQFNANSIDAGLQRQVILQDMLEEFAVPLLPFQDFSSVHLNVPLEGTDEVDVPFYPLATGAGNSWDPAAGYAAASLDSTTTNTRPVVVGGSGTTSGSSAAANTAKDRKWIGAVFSSVDMARQPYLNVAKLMRQKANRLAVLIFSDIVSRVITNANFGNSIKAVAAQQFSSDDIADLYDSATGANWPLSSRSLVLNHTYNTSLLKDPTYKYVNQAGTDETLRRARISSAYQFENISIVPNLTSYAPTGENLVGWINWLYAVLIATAPIMPSAAVRALLTRYEVVMNPQIGVAFEYRSFGDATLDTSKEVIECSYGANKGVASALKRLTSSGA